MLTLAKLMNTHGNAQDTVELCFIYCLCMALDTQKYAIHIYTQIYTTYHVYVSEHWNHVYVFDQSLC